VNTTEGLREVEEEIDLAASLAKSGSELLRASRAKEVRMEALQHRGLELGVLGEDSVSQMAPCGA
jgi:hypothetical protein